MNIASLNVGDKFSFHFGQRHILFQGTIIEKKIETTKIRDNSTSFEFEIINSYEVRRVDSDAVICALNKDAGLVNKIQSFFRSARKLL